MPLGPTCPGGRLQAKWITAALLACCSMLAPQAVAATVLFDFRTPGSAVDPITHGARFSERDSTGQEKHVVTVRAFSDSLDGTGTAISRAASPSGLEHATLRLLATGLGVCNAAENAAGCPAYAYQLDNFGIEGEDWLLFTFDAPVNFKSITIDSAYRQGDRDVTYWIGTGLGELKGITFEDGIFPKFGGGTNVDNSYGRGALELSLGGQLGDFMLFGANQFHRSADDLNADQFVVRSLEVAIPVPAPPSLVLFASGLVLMAGWRLRRLG
jgi:hypothetical protein